MTAIPARWYFDFISPFAYLQWRRLRASDHRLELKPVPVLFAKLLEHHGHKGPAEIPGKRAFTYPFALWRAREAGIPMCCPPAHPFNPLPALRLAIALDNDPGAIDAIFAQIWERGTAGDSAATRAPIGAAFAVDVEAAIAKGEAKQRLRDNTDEAIAAGVFGVPTLVIRDRLFWGDDATGMAIAWACDPRVLDDPEMRRAANLPVAQARAVT